MTEENKEENNLGKFSLIHTACKNCVFADFTENKQIGCKVDRLKFYRKEDIINVYDEENEFFVINKSFCLYYRTKELMESLKVPEEKWAEVAKDQVKLPIHVILLFNENNTEEQLRFCLKMLKAQSIQPALVTIANKQYPAYTKNPEKYIKPSSMYKSLLDCGFKKITFKNIYDEEISDREIVDLIFDNTNHLPIPMYIVFNVDYDIPNDFIKEIDDAILNKMLTVNFANPIDDINGMLVSRVAHKKYNGNSFNVALENKIKFSEENLDKIIFNITDISPSIK